MLHRHAIASIILVICSTLTIRAQDDDMIASGDGFSALNYLEGEWMAYRAPHQLLGAMSFTVSLEPGLSDDIVVGTVGMMEGLIDDITALLVANATETGESGSIARAAPLSLPANASRFSGQGHRYASLAVRGHSQLDTTVELSFDGLRVNEADGVNTVVADADLLTHRMLRDVPRNGAQFALTFVPTAAPAPLFIAKARIKVTLANGSLAEVETLSGGRLASPEADVQLTVTVYSGQACAVSAVVTTLHHEGPEHSTSSVPRRRSIRWMLSRMTAESKQTIWTNWKPLMGTFVLLIVTFGARRGGRWYLRRKGINPEGFMKSFWGKGKPTNDEVRRAMLQRAARDPRQPLTEAQRKAIMARTDHYLKLMDEADREEGRKPAAAASK